MKILLINAHPDYQNSQRTINQLEQHSLQLIEQKFPAAQFDQLNLYDPKVQLPPITGEVLNHPETVSRRQAELIGQWKSADLIIIMMPLHNFNIVTKLKDYIDNIFIAKQTFQYTADGSIGLLDGHQKVLYVQSSGSDYRYDLRYVNADFAPHYLRTILNFMGITKMTLIRAQGLDLLGADKPGIVAQAKREITEYLENYR